VAALYVKFETGFCSIIPYAIDGQSSFRIRDSKEVNGWYDGFAIRLWDNTWYHYVVTYNARTETATAFINGEVVAIMENVPTNRFVKRIMVGGDVFQPSMQGNICEVIIYNEAKDHETIYNMHQDYVTRKDFMGFEIEDDIYK
ncbi:MAG: hypothetical protein J5972_04225, partial [Eubacterium sp.]|nr:hypothetical protein [Eubacterium sp.]